MGAQVWETPWAEFLYWHHKYNFTIDAAADKSNTKCERFWSIEDNALVQDWTGERVFCNPPYADLYPWVKKAAEKKAELSFLILPSNTDTAWFHDFIWDELKSCWRPGVVMGRFKRGRIHFVLDGQGDAPRYANLLVCF